MNVYQQIFSRWLNRTLVAFSINSKPTDIEVCIQSGTQSGDKFIWRQNAITTGSDMSNEIVLCAEDVAKKHVSFVFTRSIIGTMVTLKDIKEAIVVNGNKINREAEQETYLLPVKIKLGSQSLKISSPLKKSSVLRIFDNPKQFLLSSTASGLIAGLIVFSVFIFMNVGDKSEVNFSKNNSKNLEKKVNAIDSKSDLTTKKIMANLDSVLIKHNLQKYLKISEEDSVIIVSGGVPKGAYSKWKEIQSWFDASSKEKTMISHVKAIPEQQKIPQVEMVETGEQPRVFFSNGLVKGLQQEVIDGWVVFEISQAKLVLQRQDEIITIAY